MDEPVSTMEIDSVLKENQAVARTTDRTASQQTI